MTDDISLKKVLPHNEEAEKSVLGSILHDNNSLLKVVDIIAPSDFYSSQASKVFKVMLGMFLMKEHIDLVTVADKILQTGNLTLIGGSDYLMGLMESTPTATTVVHHAKIIKEKSQLRKLIAIATQLNIEAYSETSNVEQLLNGTEKNLCNIRSTVGQNDNKWEFLGDTLPEVYQDIQNIYESPDDISVSECIPTGFRDLDKTIIGLFNSEMIVLAARPSQGKTSLAFNIVENVASRGIPVAVFSIETSNKKAAERMLCAKAEVSSHAIHKGWLHDGAWPKLTNAIADLKDIPLYIYDCPTLSLTDFRLKTKLITQERDIKLIVIDYLQIMHIKGIRERHVMFSEISSGIKAAAREFNIPILVLSQLTRDVEKRKPPRPMLSDLRESGAIEQDADTVMFLYRPGSYVKVINEFGEEDLTTEVIIGKQRNGPTGTVKMLFEHKYTKFRDIETGGI